MSDNSYSDSLPSAAHLATEKDFHVYRLKANPTWIKFGLRASPASEAHNAASTSRPFGFEAPGSAHRDASANVNWSISSRSSIPGGHNKSTGERQPSAPRADSVASSHASFASREANNLTAAGSDAALRSGRQCPRSVQEQQEPQQRQQRSTFNGPCQVSSLPSSSNASVARKPDHSCASHVSPAPSDASRSAFSYRNDLHDSTAALSRHGIYTTRPPSRDVQRLTAELFLRDRTNQTCGKSDNAKQVSGSVDHTPSLTRSVYDSLSSEPEAVPQSMLPRYEPTTSVSTARSSTSRAAASHLSGSAAVVDTEGPLDSLYVPLRRPAPRNCEATQQHFSIFDVADKERVSSAAGGRALPTRQAQPARRVFDSGDAAAQAWAPSNSREAYQTSNSTYGRGFQTKS